MGAKVDLTGGNLGSVPHPIDLGEAGSFSILVRRPTYDELLADMADDTPRYMERRLGLITGWEGMEDPQGNPIPYDLAKFKALCELYPQSFRQFLTAVNQRFRGEVGGPEKNSGTVSGNFSADTVLKSLRSMPTSGSAPLGASPVPLEQIPETSEAGTGN